MLFGLNEFTSSFGHEQDGLLFTGKLSTPPLSDEVARQESMIAARLFSPGFGKASEVLTSRLPWNHPDYSTGCNTENEGISNDCEGCLANRPENSIDHSKSTLSYYVIYLKTVVQLYFSGNDNKCTKCLSIQLLHAKSVVRRISPTGLAMTVPKINV